MTFRQALRYFGTKERMARCLGKSLSSVYDWETAGRIPLGVQYQISLATDQHLAPSKPAFRENQAEWHLLRQRALQRGQAHRILGALK